MICLFNGPYVLDGGRRVEVPEGSKRLLAYVALHGGNANRRQTAGTLWPFGDDERAFGNLRSALWRLRCAGIEVLTADKRELSLQPDTAVDICRFRDWAGRVIDGTAKPEELSVFQVHPDATNLLPGWYDDWIIFERERIRQLLLHALEVLSRYFVDSGRFGEGVEAALRATSEDPLRESAQRTLIAAHMAEGNHSEAARVYDLFCDLIQRELGTVPTSGRPYVHLHEEKHEH
jgi:DNA-binding SARP family transcriptional activator